MRAFRPSPRRPKHRSARLGHDRANVREVEIDQALLDHRVRSAGDARAKHLISHCEGVGDGRFLVEHAEKVLVRDIDQRVDRLLYLGCAGLRDPHAAAALEVEGLRDDADAHLTSGSDDNAGGARDFGMKEDRNAQFQTS